VDVLPELIHRDVGEGYGPVADAYRRNSQSTARSGAACSVYRDGRKVVDLWGGYRDGMARTPWREDLGCGDVPAGVGSGWSTVPIDPDRSPLPAPTVRHYY
jgi:hypothetical protein